MYIPTVPLSTPLMSLPKRFYLTAPAEAEETVCLEDTAKGPPWIQDLQFMLRNEKSDSANTSTEPFLPGIRHQACCPVWTFLEGKLWIGWEAKALWPWTSYAFRPAHYPTGTPLLYPPCQCTARRWNHTASRHLWTPIAAHTARHESYTEREQRIMVSR